MPSRTQPASSRTFPLSAIQERILYVRGHKVLLDFDLAALYGVTTRRLNEKYAQSRAVS